MSEPMGVIANPRARAPGQQRAGGIRKNVLVSAFGSDQLHGQVLILDRFVRPKHLGGLAVEVNDSFGHPSWACGAAAPLRRVEGERRCYRGERECLELLEPELTRASVEGQSKIAETRRIHAGLLCRRMH